MDRFSFTSESSRSTVELAIYIDAHHAEQSLRRTVKRVIIVAHGHGEREQTNFCSSTTSSNVEVSKASSCSLTLVCSSSDRDAWNAWSHMSAAREKAVQKSHGRLRAEEVMIVAPIFVSRAAMALSSGFRVASD